MIKRVCEDQTWIAVSKVGSREHRNQTTGLRTCGNLANC
jgi:hypothetical protein